MSHLKTSTTVAIRALRGVLWAGYDKLTKRLAISVVLACVNLALVGAIYGFISGRTVSAAQFVLIPVVLLSTVASAAWDFLRPRTRLQSVVALLLSVPVGFMYLVWHGWISL
jgi:hypothetical protein